MSETCDECGHGFNQHHGHCSRKSSDDSVYPSGKPMSDMVNHPAHYGGVDDVYEAIKVIEAWNLGFCLGNTVKYIARAGKKTNNSLLQELKKARWYLDREITRIENPGDHLKNENTKSI